MKVISQKQEFLSTDHAYLIDDDGNKYFFKELTDIEIFRELLASEIASILGINHLIYKPYVLNGKEGVISTDFMKEHYKYLDGFNLLYYDVLPEFSLDKDLYLIWYAMEKKFGNYPNYTEQIEKFMDDLINMIVFDLLIANYDRHSKNWIIEYDDVSFKLCPIFDNSLAFSNITCSYLNTVSSNIPNKDALKHLLKESDDSIYQKYAYFSSLVNPDNIGIIVDNTMKKYNFFVNREDRKKIIDNFVRNYKELESVSKEEIYEVAM